ncbi:hypothetical protein BRADI_4g13523v3 [Brachypodium distachyon]|uniref:Uncharacterized protein n=1 Tax=Brachypodium distachyon TaxID=15368 RepID=A0A2K2CMK2_BRADI|nr:hypothetical protein BRADI_4g13523v3 [Brachypodium distachyon]
MSFSKQEEEVVSSPNRRASALSATSPGSVRMLMCKFSGWKGGRSSKLEGSNLIPIYYTEWNT